MRNFIVPGVILVALAFVLGSRTAASISAITVNTLVDEQDGSCSNGDCSLRDAIAIAAAGDTISFSVSGTLSLTLGQLALTKNLTLSGPGEANLTLSGDHVWRVISVTHGITVTISGLTLADGETVEIGGGVYNEGALTLTECTFLGNHASDGGAIYNYDGTLIIADCTFVDNASDNDGGAVYSSMDGNVTITNSRFEGNTAGNNGGGFLCEYDSQLTLIHNTITENVAGNDGGGIYASGEALNLTSSTFSNNQAGNNGGGMVASFGSMDATGTVFSGNTAGNSGGGFYNDGTSGFSGCTFSTNHSGGDGGAVLNSAGNTLAVMGCAFSSNSAATGGAIANLWGAVTATNGTFWGNSADVEGGAIDNIYGSTLTVTNSTFWGNSTSGDGKTIGNWGDAEFTNTIVANSPSGGDCAGSAFLAGSAHNLGTDSSCSPGFTQVTTTQLALGVRAGSPAYYPLKSGSVAIDTGTNNGCPVKDQRGRPRPMDGNGDGFATCDVGSYEVASAHEVYLPFILRR